MSWAGFVVPVAIGIAVILTPGLLILTSVRLTLVPRIAVAALAGTGSTGVAAVVFGAMGAAWSPWQSLVPAAAAAGVLFLLGRRRVRIPAPSSRLRDGWILVAIAVAGTAAAVIAFGGVPDPDRLSQTYDNVFHMSAIASIVDGGNASSLSLRTLIETDRAAAYYPSAWHVLAASIVQLAGVSPAVAVNAAWVAAVTAIWVPGCAWLAQVIVPDGSRRLTALIAIAFSVAFAAMPYALMTWGSLYPTFLATALLPAAVAVPIVSARIIERARSMRLWRGTVFGVLAIGGSVVTLAFAQPRVLASWALILAPAFLVFAVRTSSLAWKAQRTWDRRWRILMGAGFAALLVAGLAAAAAVAVRLEVFSRPLADRLSGPQATATQSVTDGVLQAAVQAWPTGVDTVAGVASPLLAVVVVAGLIVAARTRGLRWVAVAYVLVVVLYALAAGSDDVFAKLATGIWYKDRYRLASLVPVLGVVLATLAMVVLGRWMQRHTERRAAALLATVGASAAIGGLSLAFLAPAVTPATAEVLRLPERVERGEVVSAAQIRFLASIGEVVPEGQRVLGDPWDGSAWTQLLGDREPVFPHVNGQWDPDRATLAWNLQDIDADPRVCAALDALRVRYVHFNPHEFGGGDPAGNHFPGPHAAVEAGLFSEVRSDGDSVLYRIDQCGPLPEENP